MGPSTVGNQGHSQTGSSETRKPSGQSKNFSAMTLLKIIGLLFCIPISYVPDADIDGVDELLNRPAESAETAPDPPEQEIFEITVRVVDHKNARAILKGATEEKSVKFLSRFAIFNAQSPLADVVLQAAYSEKVGIHVDAIFLGRGIVVGGSKAVTWKLARTMSEIENYLATPNDFNNTVLMVGHTLDKKQCKMRGWRFASAGLCYPGFSLSYQERGTTDLEHAKGIKLGDRLSKQFQAGHLFSMELGGPANTSQPHEAAKIPVDHKAPLPEGFEEALKFRSIFVPKKEAPVRPESRDADGPISVDDYNFTGTYHESGNGFIYTPSDEDRRMLGWGRGS
ncbi:hypothetical protein TWF192_000828 [Orbilia oligospora]|uniref:Uncharacterized protein n=1 Tax=Orbilia oligospora TaxID=2813651 RepID=A0A6G1MGB7_ORBOL|nr:hypothetical protein TWF191_008830 [Orbilia oligospora]KAF3257535.1 hypothetical protein TWF192_000828 [Orbilia oligospora]